MVSGVSGNVVWWTKGGAYRLAPKAVHRRLSLFCAAQAGTTCCRSAGTCGRLLVCWLERPLTKGFAPRQAWAQACWEWLFRFGWAIGARRWFGCFDDRTGGERAADISGRQLACRRWCVCVALRGGVYAWLVLSLLAMRVVLMCFQLVQLSCLASGDSALWRGIWRRPVPSSWAGGDGWCFMRAVGCLGASFVWVGTGEPLMLAYMHQSTWVGKVEGGLGRASCRLMRRAVRQTRVAHEGRRRSTGRVLRGRACCCARAGRRRTSFCCCDPQD